MTTEQLRRFLLAQPFRPFTMHLADGRQIMVKHPEFVAANPVGRTAIVFYPDDTFEAIDVLLVTSIKTINGARRRRRRTASHCRRRRRRRAAYAPPGAFPPPSR
ncbi:MAG: hypothetical protein HY763_08375 [Planctomycetes bacterium]|nr:hypothetical protein [Planctomycetota bacterium]